MLRNTVVQQAIVDTKNLDIYLPENMTEEDISFILHQCVLQIPFIPAKDITSLDIIKFLYNKIIEDPGISGNFVLEMKVYTLIYNIALICNDYKSAENVYEQISQNINKWDDAIFRYWFGDKKTIWKDCKNMILIELIFKLISKTIC